MPGADNRVGSGLPPLGDACADIIDKPCGSDGSDALRDECVASVVVRALADVGKEADGAIRPGATIDIYLKLDYGGEPLSFAELAVTIAHELVHLLGSPELDWQLHDPSSNMERDVKTTYSATTQ